MLVRSYWPVEGYKTETRGDGCKPVRKYPFDAVGHPVVLHVHVHCQAANGSGE